MPKYRQQQRWPNVLYSFFDLSVLVPSRRLSSLCVGAHCFEQIFSLPIRLHRLCIDIQCAFRSSFAWGDAQRIEKRITIPTCIIFTHRFNTKPKQEEGSSQAEIYKYYNRVDVAVGVVALGVEMKET